METMFDQVTDWKKQRLGKISSSEVSKLLQSGRKKEEYFGQGALTYIYEKVAEIITGEAPEVTSKSLEWGASNEYDAILEYQAHTGESVEYFGVATPKFFDLNDFSGGSPDGLTTTKVLEVKCPYVSSNHIKFLLMESAEELKLSNFDYYCQAQMNMMSAKREEADFISYDPRIIEHKYRLKIIPIPKDEEIMKEIEERITRAVEIITLSLTKISSK